MEFFQSFKIFLSIPSKKHYYRQKTVSNAYFYQHLAAFLGKCHFLDKIRLIDQRAWKLCLSIEEHGNYIHRLDKKQC